MFISVLVAPHLRTDNDVLNLKDAISTGTANDVNQFNYEQKHQFMLNFGSSSPKTNKFDYLVRWLFYLTYWYSTIVINTKLNKEDS